MTLKIDWKEAEAENELRGAALVEIEREVEARRDAGASRRGVAGEGADKLRRDGNAVESGGGTFARKEMT